MKGRRPIVLNNRAKRISPVFGSMDARQEDNTCSFCTIRTARLDCIGLLA